MMKIYSAIPGRSFSIFIAGMGKGTDSFLSPDSPKESENSTRSETNGERRKLNSMTGSLLDEDERALHGEGYIVEQHS